MYDFKPVAVDWMMILPIIIVVSTGVLSLILKMVRVRQTNIPLVYITISGLIAAGICAGLQLGLPHGETCGQLVVRDHLSTLLQILLIGITLVVTLFSEGYLREKQIAYGEFYPLAVWATVGAMIMVSTKNLLMFFLGIEVLSISLYVLVGMSRQENRSEESAMKYFLLGSFASCFLLYGIAFLYGGTGGLDISLFSKAWLTGDLAVQRLLLFGLGLLLVGLLFKGSFFPFNVWTPDVYQGAPTNVTALMASGTKVAAIVLLYRILEAALPIKELWMPLLFWVSILTMTTGNLMAIAQKDVKRIIGYSSISNAGYILVALLAHFNQPTKINLFTTVFYLISYSLMTTGALAVITLTARSGKEGTGLKDLHGLWHRSPFAAIALLIFMASLIGIPPTAGFFAKFLIIRDALQSGLMPLAILLVINSIISIYYYAGIAQAAFVSGDLEEGREHSRPGFGWFTACTACLVGVLIISLFTGALAKLVAR